jgi:hypothetical protein
MQGIAEDFGGNADGVDETERLPPDFLRTRFYL